MNHTTQILNLYYIQHKKIIEIQKILNISSPYISKIIKKDYRYEDEKNNRKKLSIEKRKKNQRNFIKNKREIQKYCDNYLLVQAQHIQASKELSKKDLNEIGINRDRIIIDIINKINGLPYKSINNCVLFIKNEFKNYTKNINCETLINVSNVFEYNRIFDIYLNNILMFLKGGN